MSRESDERLCSLADRLRLPYLRDHMTEVLENIAQAKMTPRQAIEYAFGKEVQQRECNRFKQLLQSAHLPTIKKLEDFDLTAQPSINPGLSVNWPAWSGLTPARMSPSSAFLVWVRRIWRSGLATRPLRAVGPCVLHGGQFARHA